MSGYQPIPKRTSSPFSTRDQIKQKQLQKQTERILLTNQRSNQSIATKLQANIDSTNSHTNTSPQISPRSKVFNESFRITTLTSLKREGSPDSLLNTTKQTMNPTSSPCIPSLVHIPQEQQQDHINLGHKLNSKSNSISNNGGCPQYEETPKFKINKTENVLSFLHRPFGSTYLEEDNSSKEDACGSCFSFGHEVSRDEDKIVGIMQSTPQQTTLTTINNNENGSISQVQHIQQGTTKKHVSFCPQIDQNIEQVEEQQRNPQYQLITLKSCLGDNQQQCHKDQQIPNIDQPIEIRENIIINQPIFESFAPQANFQSNQGFNSQLEIIQSQPQELNNPIQEKKKNLDLPLRIRKESIIEEILVGDVSKMEGNSKLNMLRERMVKPQADSTIAKYIKASCIKKASSLEFIDIPSQIYGNAKKNEENEQERIPLLIPQLKSNLSGDFQKANEQIINCSHEKHENDIKQNQQDNLNQQINGYQDSKIQLRNGQDNNQAAFNISKEVYSQKNINTLEKITANVLKQDGEIFNSFEIKNYESEIVHNNIPDEILFQQPITAENSEKLQSAAVLLGDRNQKQNNNLKKSNTNSNYQSQDISAYNGDTFQALQKISTPTCKTAVISLNIKPNLPKEGFQAQQQTSSEELLPQQLNIYTGTIHLEPLITESKMLQTSPIKKSLDSTQGSFNRIDNPPPPIETAEVSQTPTMSLDLQTMAFKIKEDSKNEFQFSNDDSSSYSNQNNISKSKQISFAHNSPFSSNNNNTTMASTDETAISAYSSEVAAFSSPQSQEYFTTSYLKPSPMPIINGQFTNNLNLKSSNLSNNFNTNNKINKQDPCSSPVTSYLPSPKKQSKKQPMDSLRLDSSLDFSQKNLAQDKSTSTFSRPQPASHPSPNKAYSQFIRQSFFQQPSNHNFNHSQENIHEDQFRSKQKVLSSSAYISQSSSLIRSSSPSKLKQNPYDIQPQTVKSSTKIVIEKKGDISSKINAIPHHQPSYSYSIKSGYSTKTTNDAQFKTPNRIISSIASGSQYLSQTKMEQEFSYYQLSQNNLEKGQTPQSQSFFNSEVSLPFH